MTTSDDARQPDAEQPDAQQPDAQQPEAQQPEAQPAGADAPSSPDMNPDGPDMNPDGIGSMLPEAVAERDLTPGASPELVQAFRMNAEALHRLQDMQQQLVTAVQRGNRSETMIQNTQALNETFRNLTQVQRKLLDRVDGVGQRSPSRLVPLMLLGLLIVLVGGVAVIVESVRQGGGGAPALDQAKLAEQVRVTFARGRDEGAAQRASEIARLQTELAAADQRIIDGQAAMDEGNRERQELERGNQALEYTNQELAKEVSAGRQAAAVNRALKQELDRIQLDEASAENIVAAHKAEVEEIRGLNLELRKRLGSELIGVPYEPDYDPAYDPNAPVDREPSVRPIQPNKRPPHLPNMKLANDRRTPAGTPVPGAVPVVSQPVSFDPGRPAAETVASPGAVPPPPVVRRSSGSMSGTDVPRTSFPPPRAPGRGMAGSSDVTKLPAGIPPLPTASAPVADLPVRANAPVDRRPEATSRMRTVLNGLLRHSRDSSGMLYKVTKLTGVGSNRLTGMRLIRFDDASQTPEIISAKDARVVVDRSRQEVALYLRDGERIGKAQRERIPPQGARVTVARGAAVQAWLNAGLPLTESR